MAVISDNNPYNVPANLMYSFPVEIKDGKWSIKGGLAIDDFSQEKMDITAKELEEERDAALVVVGDKK
jgi:malate/lactate dehydrogenase